MSKLIIVLSLLLTSISIAGPIDIVGGITNDLRGKGHMVDLLVDKGATEVTIRINSYGGNVPPTVAFILKMKKHQANGVRFICLVGKKANSSAFFILSHCNERYVSLDTVMLTHNMFLTCGSKCTVTIEEMKTHLKENVQFHASIRENFKVSDEEYSMLVKNETRMTPKDVFMLDTKFISGMIDKERRVVCRGITQCLNHIQKEELNAQAYKSLQK